MLGCLGEVPMSRFGDSCAKRLRDVPLKGKHLGNVRGCVVVVEGW